jgi:hypothetical protein
VGPTDAAGRPTIWEAPPGEGIGWEAPVREIDAAVRHVMERYDVAGFYCDPNKWESFVASWEGVYGAGVTVKASAAHPFTWWPSEKKSPRPSNASTPR